MKRTVYFICALTLGAPLAHASDLSGNSALALSGLVAKHQPGLTHKQRRAMAKMLDGKSNFLWPAGVKIQIAADSIVCRASNVAISAHSCELKFGATTRSLNGRAAHEIYATLIEAGVPGDGAAGSMFESLSHLACTIDPNEVKANGGGGASCSFTPGS